MRVFAVSECFCFGFRNLQRRDVLSLVEIIENMRVVIGRNLESLRREIMSVSKGSSTILISEFSFQFGVLSFGSNDRDVFKILCGCADQGNSADVDLLNHLCFTCVGSYCFFKRIQIHYHQINCRNVKFLSLSQILTVFSSVKNASKNCRV